MSMITNDWLPAMEADFKETLLQTAIPVRAGGVQQGGCLSRPQMIFLTHFILHRLAR